MSQAMQWVRVVEANEGSFSLEMPAGWRHEVALLRLSSSQARQHIRAVSPDGSVTIYLNDPNFPTFVEPSLFSFFPNPGMQTAPYTPAPQFFSQYIAQTYRGATVTDVADSPRMAQAAHSVAAPHGGARRVDAAELRFTFTPESRRISSLLRGYTAAAGQMWVVSASGLFCDATRTVDDWVPVLDHMENTLTTNAAWVQADRQRMQAAHQQTMDQIDANTAAMTAGHQQRMADIAAFGAASTASHQSRMADIDAGMASWQAQQASSDRAHSATMDGVRSGGAGSGAPGSPGLSEHDRFLNVMKGEETVTTESGQSWQVESGHDRYYVDEANNTYIATDATTEQADLTAKHGVADHTRWDEGQIRR